MVRAALRRRRKRTGHDALRPYRATSAADRLADNCLLAGHGQRAIIVGCGLGADAEYVAGRGFSTVAFDISETAIRVAQRRHSASTVDYVVADLLNPRLRWERAFDFVIEIITVQTLPDPPRRNAIANISRLVGVHGTLLVVAAAPGNDHTSSKLLPPWPLDEDEIEAFASDDLTLQSIETVSLPDSPARAAGGQNFTEAARHPMRVHVGQDGSEGVVTDTRCLGLRRPGGLDIEVRFQASVERRSLPNEWKPPVRLPGRGAWETRTCLPLSSAKDESGVESTQPRPPR